MLSFQNNFKNLDPSYKTDLDLRDCLGRGKLALEQNVIGLVQLFVAILEGGGNPSYSRIYMVDDFLIMNNIDKRFSYIFNRNLRNQTVRTRTPENCEIFAQRYQSQPITLK